MIKLEDLKNKEHDGRICVAFEYSVEEDDPAVKSPMVSFKWTRTGEKSWELLSVWRKLEAGKSADVSRQVVQVDYDVPREDWPLDKVASMGLMLFNAILIEDVQQKTNCNMILSEVLR